MFFSKKKRKKGMIDVAELQKRGRIASPETRPSDVVTDSEGFVEMGGEVSGSFTSASRDEEGYSKREVDSKIQQLDSMIYKLEQRIELLEKKAGIDRGTDSTSNAGLISW